MQKRSRRAWLIALAMLLGGGVAVAVNPAIRVNGIQTTSLSTTPGLAASARPIWWTDNATISNPRFDDATNTGSSSRYVMAPASNGTAGQCLQSAGTTLAPIWGSCGGGGAFYQTFQNAGSGLTQRATGNFTSGLTAVDNAGASRTDVSLDLTHVNDFTADQGTAVYALTDGATISTDCSLGNVFTVTLGGNRTLANPTNVKAGHTYAWSPKQDGTGSRTLSYGTNFKWPSGTAPTLTTTATTGTDWITCFARTTSELDCVFQADFH